jgi:hypothetical protein
MVSQARQPEDSSQKPGKPDATEIVEKVLHLRQTYHLGS